MWITIRGNLNDFPLSATWQIFRVQPRSEDATMVSCCQHNQSVRHLQRHKRSSEDLMGDRGQQVGEDRAGSGSNHLLSVKVLSKQESAMLLELHLPYFETSKSTEKRKFALG